MDKTQKKRPLVFSIIRYTLISIAALFLTYAVLFSIAGTTAIIIGYTYIMKPVKKVMELRTRNPLETAYMGIYKQEMAAEGKNDTIVRKFIPFDSISQHLKSAVLAAEDDGFYTHPGFDIEAMLSAVEYNRTHGSLKRGASTITQQLAKNLFLTEEKSFERKFEELAYTLLMERYLGKQRIFELYLNYAQWGKSCFGCEAAAQQYFKKSAKNLTRGEAARMAAVLAMPTKITPLASQSVFMGKRLLVIANNLYLHHNIDDSGYISLTGQPPPGADSTFIDTISTMPAGKGSELFKFDLFAPKNKGNSRNTF